MSEIVARADAMETNKKARQAKKAATKGKKTKAAPYRTGGKNGTERTAQLDPRTRAPLPPPDMDPTPAPPITKMGRPSDYDPAMCERMIEFGRQGYAVVEIAVGLGIGKRTLYQWVNDETKPEFAHAFLLAKDEAEAFHARIYRVGLQSPSSVFNAMGYAKYMGTVFADWRDVTRTEITGKDGGAIEVKSLPPKELAKRMAFLLHKAEADQQRSVH